MVCFLLWDCCIDLAFSRPAPRRWSLPLLCLCPQRSGSCAGTLRETAALQPAQVQLFPLRAGLVWPPGSAGGDRENHIRGLCGEGKSEYTAVRDEPFQIIQHFEKKKNVISPSIVVCGVKVVSEWGGVLTERPDTLRGSRVLKALLVVIFTCDFLFFALLQHPPNQLAIFFLVCLVLAPLS